MKNFLVTTAMISMLPVAASAATQMYMDSVALSTTNWSDSISVSQFDGSLGTLNSVTVELEGTVEGNAFGESLDASPATIALDLAAELTASTTALGDLATALPIASETFAASAADGAIDFGGTAGISFIGLSNSDTDTGVLTGADMDEFIGMGLVTVLVDATGESTGSGAGNLITQFATSASAKITVIYDYTENPVTAVPVPAALPLMLGALGFAGFVGRRRRG